MMLRAPVCLLIAMLLSAVLLTPLLLRAGDVPPTLEERKLKAAPSPISLIKAATTRPWPGENYPVLPAVSTEMRGLVSNEIARSAAIRKAYEKLDATGRNVNWFQGVKELEQQKAVWSLLSCLCHPHDDVQIHALKSLQKLGDQRAVPFLLLYAEHMAVWESGSENATLHGIIHESTATTLSALTGVQVVLKGQDPEGLKKGLRQWRRWLVEQDKDRP